MGFYLEKLLNKKINLIHFIGIGGTSMSSLARIALSKGISVSGSDMKSSSYTWDLLERGAKIHIGHSKDHIPEYCDLVVYSAAINKQNPEIIRAKELGIPVMERSDFLGALTKDYKQTIAVSGTHGKTTTSALISALLYNGNLDPTVSIGGSLDLIGGNCRIGNSPFFVTEACEYVDSFLKSSHKIGIILNIELEHLDYFKSIDQLKDSFVKFAQIIPEDGILIANGDQEDVMHVVQNLDCKVVTFGLKKHNDWRAVNIVYNNLGKPSFDIIAYEKYYGHFQLDIPGEHNILNALASIICADYLGVDKENILDTVSNFKGAKRRFELRGIVNDIMVFEDYAHHPTELKVTIDACTNYDYRKLWVVFQAHTYSRVYYFFDEFVDSFKGADYVIVNDIYSDREANIYNIHAKDLVKAIKERLNIPAVHISQFQDIVDYLIKNTKKGDFVLVAGSQTINQVAYDLVDALSDYYSQKT